MSRTDTAAARARVRAWKALGAPSGAGAALIVADPGLDLALAVNEVLQPATLTVTHRDPPPAKARFETTPHGPIELAANRPGGFDLILTASVLEQGDLSDVRAHVAALRDLLAPGGVLAASIATLGAPGGAGSHDALLFPHMARAGTLGEDVQFRAPLPASSWALLVQAAGLEVRALDNGPANTLPDTVLARHEPRLSAYDPLELSVADLILVAVKPGERS